MTLNHFIFSKSKKDRIFRHITAWVILYVLAIITYPPKGAGSINGLGLDGFWVYYRMVCIRTFQMILCQMLFAYLFLYILVPFYLRKKKYISFILLLLATWTITAVFRYMLYVFVYNPIMQHFHYHINFPDEILLFSFRQTISGPAFLGGLFIAFKLLKDYQQKQTDNFTLQKESARAELQLLKAQIHPHFLFNTLNNIYSFTISHSPKASELVQQLYMLMNYMMNECNDPLVSLEKEIQVLRNFMDLEKVRYGDRLDLEIDIRGIDADQEIAPLLMISFLENSFKHGASRTLNNPWIKLHISVVDNMLYFELANSKPEENETAGHKGIGLSNVKKRLELIYGSSQRLLLENTANYYSVMMEVPLQTRH